MNLLLILQRVREALAVLRGEALLLQGHVYTSVDEQQTWAYHGRNLITDRFRTQVAGILARPSADYGAVVVSYDADRGYDAGDLVFPAYITVGTGNTAAQAGDEELQEPLYVGGSVAKYPITRILFHADEAEYPPDPIHVGFYALIPAGEVYDDVGTDVVYREFGLWDWNDRLLARKVVQVSKNTDLSLWVNWQVRT